MNLKQYIAAFLFCYSAVALAQENDRNVTVEREYKPVIQDAGKINSVPAVTEPVVQKSTASYTDVNLPLSVGPSIHTLSAADLDLNKRLNPAAAFIRIGAGNYVNNMLDFYFPVLKTDNSRLDVKVDHLASFGKKAHSTTNGSVHFNSFVGSVELLAGGNVGFEYLKYYGTTYNALGDVIAFDSLKNAGSTLYEWQYRVNDEEVTEVKTLDDIRNLPETNRMWRLGAFFGVRSLPENTDFNYNATVSFNRFSSTYGLAENMIYTKGGFNKLDTGNRWGLDFDLRNLFYSSQLEPAPTNTSKSYTVLGLNPFYGIERDQFAIRLGVKTFFSFGQGSVFSPSPDLFAEWKVKPEWLALYAGVSGGYQINTLDQAFGDNRYLIPELRIEDTYTPIHAYVGAKVKPIHNLLLDAFISYRMINNQFFYTNQSFVDTNVSPLNVTETELYGNRFNVVYSKASLTNLGLRANYNVRNRVNVQLKTVYNAWKTFDIEEAWHKPKFETDLTSEVRISRSLMANASVFFKSSSNAPLGARVVELPSAVDANLGVSYTYQTSLSFFGRLNNLFNAKYQEFNGYDVQGFNVMFGASYSF